MFQGVETLRIGKNPPKNVSSKKFIEHLKKSFFVSFHKRNLLEQINIRMFVVFLITPQTGSIYLDFWDFI